MANREPIDITTTAFAEFFDELPLWSTPFALMLLEKVPLRRGMTILDIGAGTGFLSIELAQRCGSDSAVIAVDPWAAAAARLRRKLEFRGITNVQILEQDAANLNVPDASVDLIVSNLGINNFDNAAAVLDACARAAKPGASLLLTTNLVGHMQEFYDSFRRTLIELGLSSLEPALENHIQHRATPESLARLLTSAGFQITKITNRSFRMRFADGSCFLNHHLIRSGFLPAWKSIIPTADADRFFIKLESELNQYAKSHGELSLTIPMACVEARKR